MKKILYLFALAVFIGCNSESSLDCIQSAGDIIEQEYFVNEFKDIIVSDKVKLIFSQGDTHKVIVQTGKNLLDEIQVSVEDSVLKVNNKNGCNLIRNYGITKVFVTSPNIEKIYNRSGLEARSIGEITYEKLELISEDSSGEGEIQINGDFVLDNINVNELRVIANGLSKFYLSGKAITCHFGAYDSDVRIEAANLEIQHLYFYHRSTNKIIVNPQQSIRGKIIGLGDVISLNRPPIIEVEELNTGRLIFE